MDKKMKECMKPHALAHLVSGAGVMLILVALLPTLASNALILGVIILAIGVGYDYMVNKG